MDIPEGYLNKFRVQKKHAPKNERQELMEKFLERLNSQRKPPYKPIPLGRLLKIFQDVPTEDLYPFFKTCSLARNFSSRFWYAFKNK